MNWRLLGGMLTVLAFCSGIVGLCAGLIADQSVDIHDKGRMAVNCFEGRTDACLEGREHDLFVAQWKGYGAQFAIGCGLLFIVGVSIFVAGWSQKSEPRIVDAESGEDDRLLSADELAKAQAIERELALRGIRIE